MAWIKVPPEHHPLFRAALPDDRRVETMLSTIVLLDDVDRAEALALDGAAQST